MLAGVGPCSIQVFTVRGKSKHVGPCGIHVFPKTGEDMHVGPCSTHESTYRSSSCGSLEIDGVGDVRAVCLIYARFLSGFEGMIHTSFQRALRNFP